MDMPAMCVIMRKLEATVRGLKVEVGVGWGGGRTCVMYRATFPFNSMLRCGPTLSCTLHLMTDPYVQLFQFFIAMDKVESQSLHVSIEICGAWLYTTAIGAANSGMVSFLSLKSSRSPELGIRYRSPLRSVYRLGPFNTGSMVV